MSAVHRHIELNTIDVGNPPSSRNGNKWKDFHIYLHGFANLPSGRGEDTLSPAFECNGLRWRLIVYPGGHDTAQEGYVSVHLTLGSPGTATITFDINILQKFGTRFDRPIDINTFDIISGRSYGASNLVKRSDILDPSKNLLDDNGTLAFIVSIKEEETEAMPTAFVPNNPFLDMIQEKFLDEETADVCFEVSSSEIEEDRSKRSRSSTSFHAHSQILNICAPMLASLFESNEDRSVKVASITDVSPDIFRHILFYVYGGRVPKDLKAHAKSIINAADKYSIVNLKLEAEAVYVKETDITMDNAIDNLLYADAKNLALLKEAVMDFLAENTEEASEKISFSDVPGHVMKDLMVAFSRKEKTKQGNQDGNNNFTIMRVSELRKKLDEKGLNVDGSRETMIEALKSSDIPG
mmetsp:Transcript_23155/g.35760  ORF Transcript_23155/g.35760 Transcript_23155/m.35760 type:complete len:409 (-) Transcript_23155:203-1429(-)